MKQVRFMVKENLSGLTLKQLTILIFIFFSVAGLLAIADRAPYHLEKRFPESKISDDFTFYLDGVLNKTLPGPYIYRILIPYSVDFINKIIPAVSPVTIDLILKFMILFLCQLSFFFLMYMFFSAFKALSGVFLLDVLTGFSLSYFQGPSIPETADLLNMAIFSLVITALYKNSFTTVCVLLFIGMLNRETPILLLPVIFLYDYINKKGFLRSIISAACILVPYLILHLLIREPDPRWVTMEGITRNIPFVNDSYTSTAILSVIRLFLLIGPLLFLSIYRFKNQLQFFKITTSVIPLFIVIHFIFGTIIEARLWMPVFVLLIPPAINTLSNIYYEVTSK